LAAGAGVDFGDRFVPAAGGPVGAPAGDGVEGVGDGEDASAEGDGGLGERVRIALPVPALVVVADDGESFTLEEGDVGEDACAQRGVRFDDLALARRERPGLLQDLVWDPDLADVVEQEAVLEAGVGEQLRRGRAGEFGRVARDAQGVGGGAGVFGLEGAGERAECLPGGLLERASLAALGLEQGAQVARVEQQLVCSRRPNRSPRRRTRAGASREASPAPRVTEARARDTP
jgi:hypothetical protein